MSDSEEVPALDTLNEDSAYKQFFKKDIDSVIFGEEPESSLYNYLFDQEDNANNISVISFDDTSRATKNSLVIDFEKIIPKQRFEPYAKGIKINFNINISNWKGKSLSTWFNNLKEAAVQEENKIHEEEQDIGEKKTQPLKIDDGGNYLARGGAPLVRRITASLNNERARQTREGQPNYDLHRSFFLIIWEHFAPNSNIMERPRLNIARPLNVRLGPIYSRDGTNHVCSVLLRCVTRDNREAGTTNIAYSVLFEFTQYIHWSIFYSFNVRTRDGARIDRTGQVSELHFTLNEYRPPRGELIPKTRMFFEYTDYINDLIRRVHDDDAMAARPGGELHLFSSNEEQVQIMGIVSELMLLTMYQLATAKSYTTEDIFNDAALTMRQNIDVVGNNEDVPNNQLLNIALLHVDLIDCIQHAFARSAHASSLPSHDFINHLKKDIQTAITSAATPAATRPGGGKNINRYLTKINNIKERLKLLKKNKVKNKVKITKLNKSIEELKNKLKKQKEKDKAKLKKQKEKDKAKLKKQKEKEKAKLKKQKEKDKAKRKNKS